MIVHLSAPLAIGLDSVLWSGWSILIGLVGSRWSAQRVGRDGPLTRLRAFEAGGGFYRALGIRRWKPFLPDAGGFAGGRRKSLGRPLERTSWAALAAETRRAERVHWLIAAAAPLTVVWNSGILLASMAAYALIANAPCIAAQRYNRLRLVALVNRGRRRGH